MSVSNAQSKFANRMLKSYKQSGFATLRENKDTSSSRVVKRKIRHISSLLKRQKTVGENKNNPLSSKFLKKSIFYNLIIQIRLQERSLIKNKNEKNVSASFKA